MPAMIAGKTCDIEFDIIDSDIPLLMTKKAMRKMRIDIVCGVWGVNIDLKTTLSGHYLLPLLGDADEVNIAWVFAINMETIS